MTEERARENCSFYPACYIAGDCDLDDWKHNNCGLPADQQAAKRQEWWDGLNRTVRRDKLRETLGCMVSSGKLDHLLDKDSDALTAALAQSPLGGV